MDKMFINDLEIFANHGVFEEEKRLGQKFILSLELTLNLREAAITNNLKKSVHYGELCHKVEGEFRKTSYDLIETAVEKLSIFILEEYPNVEGVKINLKKPWAPIGKHLDYAGIEIERKWHKVYIALGSNMGNKEENLNSAILKITNSEYSILLKKSAFIVTEPWGYEEQEDFLNGAIEIKTLLTPRELMMFLLGIENELKRERDIKWGPRTIDLDILLYDDIISEDEEIIIPHPRMHERDFVLEPLTQIAPYALHPVYRKRIIELLKELKK